MKLRLLAAALAGFAVLSCVGQAEAAMVLTMDDISTVGVDVTVVDNGVGDLDPTVGKIVYTGAVGSFTTHTSVGSSKPLLGGPFAAVMDLNTIQVSGVGTIVASLSDNNFAVTGGVPGDAIFKTALGGSTRGSVTVTSYYDPNNVLFGTTNSLGPDTFTAPDPNTPIGFSQTNSQVVSLTSPNSFSLTNVISITHTVSGQVTSLDVDTSVSTPEPVSALVWGGCLAGLGFGAYRRRKQAA